MVRAVRVTHGNYQINEYEVDVLPEWRDTALSFATRIKLGENGNQQNNQYSRLQPRDVNGILESAPVRKAEEIQRTAAGKLGELVFLELLNFKGITCDTSGMFEIFEGQQNTDEYDFITRTGKTVDIKAGFRENHRMLMVNLEQLTRIPKDYYVGVKLIATDKPGFSKQVDWNSIRKAVVRGYAEKTYLDRIQARNFGEAPAKAVDYNRLMGIDRLLAQF